MARARCILIIDDDEYVLGLIEDMLADDYCVDAVSDPYEGLEKIEHNGYSLLIVDLGMPQLDGAELIQRVRGQAGGQEVPILVMSAFHELRRRAAGLDVQGILPKPFQVDQFTETVEQLIGAEPAGRTT